jgi:hypothetical protein
MKNEKEYIIKYNLNNKTPNIKHLKNDYESIKKKVLENDDNIIDKVDIEKKNTLTKNIINFKIV